MNIMAKYRMSAAERFAKANGWSIGKQFSINLLISGRTNNGGNYYDSGQFDRSLIDHPEYFKVGRRPVAIAAHNYDGSAPGCADHLRAAVATRFAGQLVLHIPAAGKAASWYYPGGTMPMVLTRPDVKEIVWPTEEEMADMAAAYAEANAINRRKWATAQSPSLNGTEF
jgi:hypothetical protein